MVDPDLQIRGGGGGGGGPPTPGEGGGGADKKIVFSPFGAQFGSLV